MVDPEVIDLTNSPPSSFPRLSPLSRTNRRRSRRILSFRASSSSSRTIHFKIKRPCQPTQNPSYGYITHQVIPWFPPSPSSQICNFSQVINNFHSTMHGGDLALAMALPQFQPLAMNETTMGAPPFTTFLVTKHSEAWTPQEHEQFMKGLAMYGGCWSRIASELVVSKTGEQVESYAISFFRHLAYICLYSLRMNDQSSFTTFLTLFPSYATTMDNFNPRMMEDPPTLMLFPLTNGGRHHHQACTSCTRTRTHTNTHGHVNNNVVASNPNMIAAATGVIADAEELDLELRLGCVTKLEA